MGINHSYLTDDRDLPRRAKLVVGWAENGDFYISTMPEGDRWNPNSVRICTSGGAASANPALVRAVRDMFMALGGWTPDAKEED